MSSSNQLNEFKRLTHAFYVAYCMSNAAMKSYGEEIAEMDGVNIDGRFQVGTNDPKRKAIAELPTRKVLDGMTKNGPFSQVIAQGLIVWVYGLWEEYRKRIADEWAANRTMCFAILWEMFD